MAQQFIRIQHHFRQPIAQFPQPRIDPLSKYAVHPLLAYELPDGRLKLIDGHLRRDIDPDMEVEVEVLDVNEEEARELLLSIDPLVGLGQMQEQLYERLRQTTATMQPELEAMWEAAAQQSVEAAQR